MALRLQYETNMGITCSCVHERYIYMKNNYCPWRMLRKEAEEVSH